MAAGQAVDLSSRPWLPPTTSAARDQALAALLSCLHRDSRRLSLEQLAELGDEDWRRFLSLTAEHKVRGLIGQRLSDASVSRYVPAEVRQALSEATRQTAARMLRAQTQVTELAGAFAVASIRVMALKGVHLAQAVYPNLTMRAMQDIDLTCLTRRPSRRNRHRTDAPLLPQQAIRRRTGSRREVSSSAAPQAWVAGH